MTADLVESHFLFSVPPDAEVSFGTPLMGLSWMLRFEFVVLPSASTGACTLVLPRAARRQLRPSTFRIQKPVHLRLKWFNLSPRCYTWVPQKLRRGRPRSACTG